MICTLLSDVDASKSYQLIYVVFEAIDFSNIQVVTQSSQVKSIFILGKRWRVLVGPRLEGASWSSVGWSGTEWPAGSLYLTPAHRLQSIRRWNIFVYAYFVEGYFVLLQVQLLIIFKLSRWSIWLVILFISLQRVTCSTCINTYTYVPFCLLVNLVI